MTSAETAESSAMPRLSFRLVSVELASSTSSVRGALASFRER